MINEDEIRIGNIVYDGEADVPVSVRAIICKKLHDFDDGKMFDRAITLMSVKYYIQTWLIPGYRYVANGRVFGKEYGLMNIAPVPLTEEWLQMFGFSKYSDNDFRLPFSEYEQEIMVCPKDGEFGIFPADGCTGGHTVWGPCQYIHELQNIYHSLTKKELKIKAG